MYRAVVTVVGHSNPTQTNYGQFRNGLQNAQNSQNGLQKKIREPQKWSAIMILIQIRKIGLQS